jgi:DNA polymerase I
METVGAGTKLEIWNNKEQEIVDIPFKPYFYSITRRAIPIATETVEKVKLISTLEEKDVWKYTFDSVKEIPEYRDDDSMEADIPFVQRVAIDDGKFFYKYPHSGELDILYWDLETDTVGKFPTPDKNPIIGIGYAFNDEEPVILLAKDLAEGDSRIMNKFLSMIEVRDPDIIVTYFGNQFDIPYLVDRLRKFGYSTGALTRSGEESFFIDDEGTRRIYVKGRCLFDIYDEVARDQSLFGIPSRKMKDVAKWFKLNERIKKSVSYKDYEIITEDLSNLRAIIGTRQLHDYLLSDVLITRELSKIYLPNMIAFAEMIGTPLNIMMQRTPSMVGTIYYARELKKQNIISDNPNYKRFPEIFGTPTEVVKRGKRKTEFIGGTKFQGAIVDINPKFQNKLVNGIWKTDFSSLYPTVMISFNLSSETCKIIYYKEFNEGFFNIENFDNYRIIEFSDNRIKKNVVIKVLKKEGFLPRSLRMFIEERKKIKDLLKTETDNNKIIELTSRSWILKVLANSSFGITTSPFFKYADAAIGIATTGIGRFLITYVQKYIGYDDYVISSDTDGLYCNKLIDSEIVSKEVNKMLKERYNIDAAFGLETDIYKSGFFTRMKNYVLIDEKDRLIKHGVSFKASSKNLIFSQALDKIAYALLTNNKELYKIAKECYQIDKRQFMEFIMRTAINRPLDEYAIQPGIGKKGCVQVQVGKQSGKYHGSDVRVGDSISYVKTHTGYEIRETAQDKKDNIDMDYYRKQVISVLEKFQLYGIVWKLKNPGQKTLEVFC